MAASWGAVCGAVCLCLVEAFALDLNLMRRTLQERYGAGALAFFDQARQLVNDSRSLDELGQLKRVNDFFNKRIRYAEDQVVWGQADYWATPLETIGKGQGDCEDFAFAKYFTLRELGVSGQRLRLLYVKLSIGSQSQAHMVLGYYPQPEAEPLILDNVIYEIRPAHRRPDLTPVFGFNAEGMWVGRTQQSGGDPSARLSHWRGLMKRAYAEGAL
jgi:predicted transglutaminase-like cysteine proteinase